MTAAGPAATSATARANIWTPRRALSEPGISMPATRVARASMKVPANQWQTLLVDVQGTHFTVSLNGQKALDWDDDTFKDAGKVGVWTKADSVTLFDDFTYTSK